MAVYPSHLEVRKSAQAGIRGHSQNAGNGLFTKVARAAGEEILLINEPFVAVLSSSNLSDTCDNCFCWPSEQLGLLRAAEPDAHGLRLKACTRCKIVKYCSKTCQSAAWRREHRRECEVYANCHPRVLPLTVRLLIRILLRRQDHALSDEEWAEFIGLESNFDNHMERGNGETVAQENIILQAQAATTYSGTIEPLNFVQTMLTRVWTNAHTLTTPSLQPIGSFVDLRTARMNHGCEPNVHITCDGRSMSVRTILPLKSNDELILSYIDTTCPTSIRQSQLQATYFFQCQCRICREHMTNALADDKITPEHEQSASTARALQKQASNETTDRAHKTLVSALSGLQDYPVHLQPYPSILHEYFLCSLSRMDFARALAITLRAYFEIDPVHYPLTWHPVRLVRKFVLLRLVLYISSTLMTGEEYMSHIQRLDIAWQVVLQALWTEVKDGIMLSHGQNSSLTREVMLIGEDLKFTNNTPHQDQMKAQFKKLSQIPRILLSDIM